MSGNPQNKWELPAAPPGPIFLNKKERDFVHQVNRELEERVIAQKIIYYPIDLERTNFHSTYGESIVKTFLAPIHVFGLVEWAGKETSTQEYGLDKTQSITIHFHKIRLEAEKDLFVREGDFVLYGVNFYEIVKLIEPRELFGQVHHRFEISAKAIQSREGLFDAS